MFSGHKLTDEEKARSIELAGMRNDIIIIKRKEKLIKRIKEIHDFTYEIEHNHTKHK